VCPGDDHAIAKYGIAVVAEQGVGVAGVDVHRRVAVGGLGLGAKRQQGDEQQ